MTSRRISRVEYYTSASHVSSLEREGTTRVIEQIAQLPFVRSVDVYPDASAKPYGFPAGLRIETEAEWLYPMSAPDLGCGYAVIDSGIDAVNADSFDNLTSVFRDLDADDRAAYRDTDVESILMRCTLPPRVVPPWNNAADENVHDWLPAIDGITDEDLVDLARSLGRPIGHFVAFYCVQDSPNWLGLPAGRIIIVIHTGASPWRAVLNKMEFYVKLAAEAISAKYISAENVANGYFPTSTESPLGRAFLGYAAAARNYGYCNRLLVADRAIRALGAVRMLKPTSSSRLLRHVDHVAFERWGESLVARRGLQRLVACRPVFVTGGANTRAYLCATPPEPHVSAKGLAPHGAAVTTLCSGRTMDVVDRTWARASVTNAALDLEKAAEAIASLEDVVAYCTQNGWLSDPLLLRPVLNYREKSHG